MDFLRRFYRRPQGVWARRALFQVHLWVGIGFALYLLVIGVTGSILVFQEEFEILSGMKPWRHLGSGKASADISTVTERLEASYPEMQVVSVLVPDRRNGVFIAVLQGARQMRVACHPVTGEVLGELPASPGWLQFIEDLHVTLLIGRKGRILNGVGGAFLLLSALTGVVIWWPGIKNWARALKVDFRRGWRRINFDLHSALGFWTLSMICMWAVSGIYFAWPDWIFQFVNGISPVISARPPVIRVSPAAGREEPDLHWMIRQAQERDPGSEWKGVVFPSGRRAPLEILMRRNNAPGRQYEDTVYFNPYTGEHLATWRYGVNQSLGDWLIWLQGPLHFGIYWGLGVKIVWALAGLALPALAITGLVMYWNRVLRRKLRRPHSAAVQV